ncbi:MAG TPA: hypothetical protein PLT63_03595 [Syntrophales bacterium]|nr:hypothetical protein [Syntrophales bacterium]
MWVRIVKVAVAWMLRKHKWMIYEMIVPDGYHVHKNPEKVKA